MRTTVTTLAIVLSILSMSCAAAPPPSEVPDDDICRESARHLESCGFAYMTPPLCDTESASNAENILTASCEELQVLSSGKADGAFCDWFGHGCNQDETLFEGPVCGASSECDAGSTCLEGHCFAGVASDEFDEILDRLTQTRSVEGNALVLLNDPEQALVERLSLIHGATRSIHIVSLYMRDDASTEVLVAALAQAIARGVEVRIIVDSISQTFEESNGLLEYLDELGADVLSFNPPVAWATSRALRSLTVNQRVHEKLFVVDGESAIVGGRNYGDPYYNPDAWRDTDVRIDGPVVTDIQRMYTAIWDEFANLEAASGCALEDEGIYCHRGTRNEQSRRQEHFPDLSASGESNVRAIYSNPRAEDPSLGYQTYLALIRSARDSILIQNAYFVPPMRLRRHLRAAVARGVRVQVITNSKTSNDTGSLWYAGANYYEELIKAGVEIYEWSGDRTMHTKAMVVDGQVAVVGSYNLDPRSVTSNSEALVVIRDGQVPAEMVARFAEDLALRTVEADYEFTIAERAGMVASRPAEPYL